MKKDKKWLIEIVENYIPLNDKTVGHVVDNILDIIRQLDEPEVLSEKWIDEHTKRKFFNFDEERTEVVLVDDLQNLLVPKQELPVIPQFMADWIEECKGWDDYEQEYDGDNAIDLFSAMDLDNAGMQDNVHDYLVDNTETFARAWLDGYEVEEEQKYYVLTSSNKILLRKKGGVVRETYQAYSWIKERDIERYQFTEQEIKDYDERYWAFAKPVEELEE